MTSAIVDMCPSCTANTAGGGQSSCTTQDLPTTSESVEISPQTSTTATSTMQSIIPDILNDTNTKIMGGVVGTMFVLTVFVCIKTRVVQRKRKRLDNHLEHVSINQRPNANAERVEESEPNENEENETNDHENYALVKPMEKCYVDLQPGEYDFLRSQRKHIQSLAEAKSEACYDQFLKPSSLYDSTRESDKNQVIHPDDEYEIVKNINKKKSDSKNLKGINFEIAPNIKRNTGYENTKSKYPPEDPNDISLTFTQNGFRAKSTLL